MTSFQSERIELFKHLLTDKIRQEFEVEDDDVIKLAIDTAGSSIREINDYLNKKIFKAVKKKSKWWREILVYIEKSIIDNDDDDDIDI